MEYDYSNSKYGVDYSELPEDLADVFYRYIEHRIPTGGFLEAVLSNDLATSLGRADCRNQLRLHSIVKWIYNEAPATCWGSEAKVKSWLEERDI